MKDITSSSSCFCSSSSPKLLRSTLLIFLNVSLFITTTRALLKLPPNDTVPAVIVFGDSIMDTGNNNNIKSVIKANFLPYGVDFPNGVPTGRFSDGRVPTDLIAEELRIKRIVPAYLDPNLKPEDLLTGVCFASAGSGYDPLTSQIVSVISLSEQLKYFEEYIEKLRELVGEERKNFILAQSLVLLVSSSNDIATTYFSLHARQSEYDVASYTTLMVDLASDFVQKLYGYGVRRIAVFSAPPLGCIPSQRTVAGGIGRDCAEHYNEASKLFNAKLSANLDSLATTLGSRVVYVDVYTTLYHIIQNPRSYGFKISDRGCCGTGKLEVSVLCNRLTASVCSNVDEYVFWDSFHPTERVYKILVSKLLDQYAHKLLAY